MDKPVQIIHVPHLDGNPTPARCNRRTGEIWINDSVWCNIKPEHRMFILLHEYGHIQLNSSDELAVDAYASDLYIKLGYSLNESVKALSRVLTGKNSQHVDRVRAQLDRAKAIDIKHNQKKSIMGNLLTMANSPWYENEYDDLFGIHFTKAGREKAKARTAIKNAKADSKIIKAQAELELAKQGIQKKSTFGEAVGVASNNLAQIAGGILGKKMGIAPGDETAVDAGMYAAAPPPAKSKTMLYVGIGVAVLAVAGVVFYIIKRRKKS